MIVAMIARPKIEGSPPTYFGSNDRGFNHFLAGEKGKRAWSRVP